MDLDRYELMHEIETLLIAAKSLSMQLPEGEGKKIAEELESVLEGME